MTVTSIMMYLLAENPLMNALANGLMIVGIGTIGWAVINKAKEGDIWSAVTTGVLGGLALAFVVSPSFRLFLIETVSNLVKNTNWNQDVGIN